MKNRVHFQNIVVSAEDLPKINKIVRLLSELAPSDAFISIEFNKADDGFAGTIKMASPLENFTGHANSDTLVPIMRTLSDLTMVHIKEWRKTRFLETPEKLIS